MEVKLDDPAAAAVRALLEDHLRDMYELSPPESVHALGVEALQRPDVTFWTVWSGAELLGCGALRELTERHGEVKSMRTAPAHRRRGAARAVLDRIILEARGRGYERLWLETGSMPAFEPARMLYERYGFATCPPFGDYAEDPNSVFMTLELESRGAMASHSTSHPSVTPGVLYHDAPRAIEWLCRVLGFEQRLVIPGANDTVAHAHLTLGNGGVMLSSAEGYAFPELCKSPQDVGGTGTVEIIVHVPDLDAHYRRAVAEGAEILIPVEDKPYGGRGYSCRDPEGHVWAFGSYDPWAE